MVMTLITGLRQNALFLSGEGGEKQGNIIRLLKKRGGALQGKGADRWNAARQQVNEDCDSEKHKAGTTHTRDHADLIIFLMNRYR